MSGLMQIEQMPEIADAIRFGSFSGYGSFLGGEGQGELTGLQLGRPHTLPPAPGGVHLGELIKQRFPPEGKAERVERGLRALHARPSIELSPEDWAWVAENAGIEDQYD